MDVGGRFATNVAANSWGWAAGPVGEGCGVGGDVGAGVSVRAGVSVGAAVGGTGVGGTAGAVMPHPANRTAKMIIGKAKVEINRQLNARMWGSFTPYLIR